MILGVTGHRPNRITTWSERAFNELIALATRSIQQARPSGVITGMAQGWDQACAVACVRLQVPFVAAVPFEGQDDEWDDRAQHDYQKLLLFADMVHVVSPGRVKDAYYIRDEWVVDNSQAMLALWDGSKNSGTGYTVNYARAGKRPVTNVWPEWEGWWEGGGYLV